MKFFEMGYNPGGPSPEYVVAVKLLSFDVDNEYGLNYIQLCMVKNMIS